MKRRLIAGGACVLLAVGLAMAAAPAQAAFPFNGIKTCPSQQWGNLRTEANGNVTQKAPGGWNEYFENGAIMVPRTTQGAHLGGSWSWSQSGTSFYLPGTYAFCSFG